MTTSRSRRRRFLPAPRQPPSHLYLWPAEVEALRNWFQHMRENIPASQEPLAIRVNRRSRMPSTQSSHAWRIRTDTSECCLLTSAQHSTQSTPWSWLKKLNLGYWTSSQTDPRKYYRSAVTPPLCQRSTPEHQENFILKHLLRCSQDVRVPSLPSWVAESKKTEI